MKRLLPVLAVVAFLNLYGPRTDAPARPPSATYQPVFAQQGVRVTTPEWHRLSLRHTVKTSWVRDHAGRPYVASTQYTVEGYLRLRGVTLTAGHSSWHSADVVGLPSHWDRLGVEVPVGGR